MNELVAREVAAVTTESKSQFSLRNDYNKFRRFRECYKTLHETLHCEIAPLWFYGSRAAFTL